MRRAPLAATVALALLPWESSPAGFPVRRAGEAAPASGSQIAPRARPGAIVCYVFGRYCRQALRVAACESGLSVWARNGQYWGLFQMGAYARARYGHGWNAWTQSRAAFRYFVDSGRDWSPWTCRP